MIFPGRCATSLNVYIYYPATELMGKKRVTYLNSAKATLLSEPNFSAWKIVFQEVPNFPSHFFPRWKWYFCSNHDWKFSFPNPDWICGEKSVISSTLGEYSQVLQLVPHILKRTLVRAISQVWRWLTNQQTTNETDLLGSFAKAWMI